MAETSFKTSIQQKCKNPLLRKLFMELFETSTGHTHDGTDSAVKEVIKAGTAINAVASQGTLTLSGVVIDGETFTIDGDVYEFLADVAQTKTSASNIAVDITSHVTASQGTLTVDTNPIVGDTFTIGTTVYTFVASGAVAGEINAGINLAAAKLNIVAAINGTDGINTAHADVSAAAFATNDCVLTALVGGTAGDAIATTETFDAETNVFDAATLGTTTAGVDCLAANADGAMIGADAGTTYSMAQGAGTTITVTATTKGVAGDLIATTEAMANGAFGQATLGDTTAGVNGTVGSAGEKLYDATYEYTAIAANTISDANWRRIALGSVY